jgi:hypothetical protein
VYPGAVVCFGRICCLHLQDRKEKLSFNPQDDYSRFLWYGGITIRLHGVTSRKTVVLHECWMWGYRDVVQKLFRPVEEWTPLIIRTIKPIRVRWVGYVARMGRGGMHLGSRKKRSTGKNKT